MPQLGYGSSEPGKGLSYSRLLTAHSCPRKFQLENIFGLRSSQTENIHFAYGHAVAAGIQSLVRDPTNIELAVVICAAHWNIGLFAEIALKKKSFWHAVEAVRNFHRIINNPATNILQHYEIAVFDIDGVARPAIELTFQIEMFEGYVYEGHIDIVLKEKGTNKFVILELKTSSFSEIHPAVYQNSMQALGYSIVLDAIARQLGDSLSSYFVFYLIYKSGKMDFESHIFPKAKTQRIKFINNLLMDIEKLEMYRNAGFYPMHGENCYEFFDPCAFFGKCEYSDDSLKALKDPEARAFAQLESFDFVFSLDEIRKNQLEETSRVFIPATNIPE
jgi:hypothetical protein